MFGYFVSTQFFADMTDINLKQMMFEERTQAISDDVVPFGFIDDGSSYIEETDNTWRGGWHDIGDTTGDRDW
jgi:hypothetical protein